MQIQRALLFDVCDESGRVDGFFTLMYSYITAGYTFLNILAILEHKGHFK